MCDNGLCYVEWIMLLLYYCGYYTQYRMSANVSPSLLCHNVCNNKVSLPYGLFHVLATFLLERHSCHIACIQRGFSPVWVLK